MDIDFGVAGAALRAALRHKQQRQRQDGEAMAGVRGGGGFGPTSTPHKGRNLREEKGGKRGESREREREYGRTRNSYLVLQTRGVELHHKIHTVG